MIFDKNLSEDEKQQLTPFLGLDSIFKEFFDTGTRISKQDTEYSDSLSDVKKYFSPITQSKDYSVLFRIDSLSVIRLFKNAINSKYNTMKIIELSQQYLQTCMSLSDIEEDYKIKKVNLEEVITLVIPDNFDVKCLNIFESTLKVQKGQWALTGILLVRNKRASSIVYHPFSKEWHFNVDLVKNTKYSLKSLNDSTILAYENGFKIKAFFYFFRDLKDASDEKYIPKTINYIESIVDRTKQSKKKGKRSLKASIGEFLGKNREIVIKLVPKSYDRPYQPSFLDSLHGKINKSPLFKLAENLGHNQKNKTNSNQTPLNEFGRNLVQKPGDLNKDQEVQQAILKNQPFVGFPGNETSRKMNVDAADRNKSQDVYSETNKGRGELENPTGGQFGPSPVLAVEAKNLNIDINRNLGPGFLGNLPGSNEKPVLNSPNIGPGFTKSPLDLDLNENENNRKIPSSAPNSSTNNQFPPPLLNQKNSPAPGLIISPPDLAKNNLNQTTDLPNNPQSFISPPVLPNSNSTPAPVLTSPKLNQPTGIQSSPPNLGFPPVLQNPISVPPVLGNNPPELKRNISGQDTGLVNNLTNYSSPPDLQNLNTPAPDLYSYGDSNPRDLPIHKSLIGSSQGAFYPSNSSPEELYNNLNPSHISPLQVPNTEQNIYHGGYENPGYNESQYKNPEYNENLYKNPEYNESQYKNPGYNENLYNNPGSEVGNNIYQQPEVKNWNLGEEGNKYLSAQGNNEGGMDYEPGSQEGGAFGIVNNPNYHNQDYDIRASITDINLWQSTEPIKSNFYSNMISNYPQNYPPQDVPAGDAYMVCQNCGNPLNQSKVCDTCYQGSHFSHGSNPMVIENYNSPLGNLNEFQIPPPVIPNTEIDAYKNQLSNYIICNMCGNYKEVNVSNCMSCGYEAD